ncbi:MAG: TetR/AcrR family transcriptional regulator [Anaerolineaceae bacterium]|nr:TetR/AcrR family transcriptional regulator [Anaerolineaceae bacterium]
MAKNKMGLKTKSIILEAAQTIFRRDGYDDCRVDDIATEAGVTKAMIYYHYESKEDMMMQLIEGMVTTIHEALPLEPQQMPDHLHQMIQLWDENQEITSFLVSRAFKDPIMFQTLQKIVAPFYDALLQGNEGTFNKPLEQTLHQDLFFFNTLPMIFFPLLQHRFAEKYNISPSKVEEQFINQFINVLSKSTSQKT